jgi:hypothetical protein
MKHPYILGAIILLLGIQVVDAKPASTPRKQAWTPEANLRPDLSSKWQINGQLEEPPNSFQENSPFPVILLPDLLIDRFGMESGYYFSSLGTSFHSRSLPYICKTAPYNVYKVKKPFLVWIGHSAPWFDEKGLGTLIRSDTSAYKLAKDKLIEKLRQTPPSPC